MYLKIGDRMWGFFIIFYFALQIVWCFFLSYTSGVCVTCYVIVRREIMYTYSVISFILYVRCNTVEKPHNFYLHKFILLRFITLLPKWMYFTIADVYNAMSGNTMPQRIMYRHFMLWMCYVLILKERSKWRKIWVQGLFQAYVRFSSLSKYKEILVFYKNPCY